jgi:Protein of unknown function (DUF2752)
LYLAGEPLPLPGGILPVCPTKALFGIDCPGCGSPRMIYSLLHLDVTSAVHYNALGQVAVLLLLWAFRAWTYGRLVGRRVEVGNTRGGLGRPPLR